MMAIKKVKKFVQLKLMEKFSFAYVKKLITKTIHLKPFKKIFLFKNGIKLTICLSYVRKNQC